MFLPLNHETSWNVIGKTSISPIDRCSFTISNILCATRSKANSKIYNYILQIRVLICMCVCVFYNRVFSSVSSVWWESSSYVETVRIKPFEKIELLLLSSIGSTVVGNLRKRRKSNECKPKKIFKRQISKTHVETETNRSWRQNILLSSTSYRFEKQQSSNIKVLTDVIINVFC